MVVTLILIKRGKSKPEPEVKPITLPDTKLSYIKVLHNGIDIKQGSTIYGIDGDTYLVKSYSTDGMYVELDENKLSWASP